MGAMPVGRWRSRLWGKVEGGRVLEVGVGTGANLGHYPAGLAVTAVDISPRMVARAARLAGKRGAAVGLAVMDAEALALAGGAFDWVVASFVLCSVDDPVAAVREMGRVCRPGGTVLLLEHVRIDRPVLGRAMDLLDPLVSRAGGPHVNRRTVENVRLGGLRIVSVDEMAPLGLVRLIAASRTQPPVVQR